MRIAFLMNLAPRKLGSFEDWVLAFCAEAQDRGHEVTIFGISPVHPTFADKLAQIGASWQELESLGRSPLRAIRHLRTYDLIDLTLVAPFQGYSILAYAALPARVVFLDQTSEPYLGYPPPKSIGKRIIRWMLHRMIGMRISGVAAVSDYVRERERSRLGLPSDKAKTIYHGVNLSRFKAAAPTKGPITGAKIICVAYLIPEKGVDYLLRAFAGMRDQTAQLMIVGDGPQADALRELAAQLGLSNRAAFLGLRDDVQDLIEQADIFVHPAVWAEAFGFTNVEAMASGRALVASRVGGIPELIEDGISGLLVEPGNVSALTEVLDRLSRDSDYRLQLGRNARRRAVEKFNVTASVQGHLDWYEALLGRRVKFPEPHSLSAPAATSDETASEDCLPIGHRAAR